MKTKLLLRLGAFLFLALYLTACSSNSNEEEQNQNSLYKQMQLSGYWTAQDFTNAQGNIVEIHFTSSQHVHVKYVTSDNAVEGSVASYKEEGSDKIRLTLFKKTEIMGVTELRCDLKTKEIHFTCDGKDYTLTKREHDHLGIIRGKWTSAYYRSHSLKPDDTDYNTVEFGAENENSEAERWVMKFEGHTNVGNPTSATLSYKTETVAWKYAANLNILLDTQQGEKEIAFQFVYRPDLKTIVLELNWAPTLPDNYITYTKNHK